MDEIISNEISACWVSQNETTLVVGRGNYLRFWVNYVRLFEVEITPGYTDVRCHFYPAVCSKLSSLS